MPVLEEIHVVLVRLTFPSTREQLIEQARDIGVPERIIERLRTLPEHMYGSTDTVMDALRGLE
ncbi:MAG: DUF2795 domain-containing protein [Armatimonadota bacterium]